MNSKGHSSLSLKFSKHVQLKHFAQSVKISASIGYFFKNFIRNSVPSNNFGAFKLRTKIIVHEYRLLTLTKILHGRCPDGFREFGNSTEMNLMASYSTKSVDRLRFSVGSKHTEDIFMDNKNQVVSRSKYDTLL